VEKTIEQRRDTNATGDDDVLLLLIEDGFQLMAYLINNVNETGEWTKVVTEVSIFVLEKNPVPTKYSDHCTISLIA
jgi:hypothetical protein